MKKFSAVIIAIFALAVAQGQKPIHDANAEKRTVGNFRGIQVATGIELILTEGTTQEVAVSAASTEFRDKIETKVEGGILKIEYDNKLKAANTRKEKKNLKAYVSYTTLDVLNAHTGAVVKIEGTLKTSALKMEVHTGAVVKGKVDINDLSVDQGTGSEVTLTGEAEKLVVEGDTGSMFHGTDLLTSDCSVTASTGAGVTITVNRELNAKVNTGAYVKYRGDAGIKEIRTNSGGKVTKI